MKKIFDQPVLKVVQVNTNIITTSPYNEYSTNSDYVSGRGGWDEEEW